MEVETVVVLCTSDESRRREYRIAMVPDFGTTNWVHDGAEGSLKLASTFKNRRVHRTLPAALRVANRLIREASLTEGQQVLAPNVHLLTARVPFADIRYAASKWRVEHSSNCGQS